GPPSTTLLHGNSTLVKADLGTKRACPSCGARFYDLTKRPIECPKCAYSFEPETLYKQRRGRQPEPAAGVVPAKEAESESGMSVVEGDEDVAIEDIEVEDDEDEADDELLDEVEEDEDDVAGII